MIKKTVITLVLIFAFSLTLTAQKKNLLLQGKVFEDATNQPLPVTFVFLSEKGSIIKIKSNGFDGSYQGILENNQHYSIGVTGWLIISPRNNIETPKEGYTELTWQFRLKKMETGMLLIKGQAFEPGSFALSGTYIDVFTEVFGFLEANANANVIVEVSTEDTYFTAKTENRQVTDSKGKIKTQKVKVSPEQQMQVLLDNRIASISSYLENFKKYNKRIIFEKIAKQGSKPKVVKQAKKTKTPEPVITVPGVNNITAKIGKIMKI